MEIRGVKGMHDLFRPEIERWKQVEEKMSQLFRSYGYGEIRTPALERYETFGQTVGDDTDIVEKQMYTIERESERFVLRPEETAACMRSIIEHQLHRSGKPERFYYYGPMFRHERPQKGRLRQFHQIGAELINDPSPGADVEIIAMLDDFYKQFQITEYEVDINSVGCNDCRPVYKEALKDFLRPRFNELCAQDQKRFERSPLRILDCKNETCKSLLKGAPIITDHLCENCKKHHGEVQTKLTALNIRYRNEPTLVRGLDYYSRTAFEFTSNLLGAQSALAGGGRYDGLSQRFGEQPFPAVGFALGVERLMIVLEQKKTLPEVNTSPFIYLAALGQRASDLLFPLSFHLKRRGIGAEMNYDAEKSLKSVLKQADRSGATFALILGDREMDSGQGLLKNMKQGTQENLDLKDLEQTLVKLQQERNGSAV